MDDDEIPEVTPEQMFRAFHRSSLHARKIPVSEFVTLDELRDAYEAGGEAGMHWLITERFRQKYLPHKP